MTSPPFRYLTSIDRSSVLRWSWTVVVERAGEIADTSTGAALSRRSAERRLREFMRRDSAREFERRG